MGGIDDVAFDILTRFHVIAVVGCSRNVGKPSHDVPEYLQQNGYKIVPVNPYADYILREKAYHALKDIEFPIDVVDVFRPASEAMDIARQALDVHAKALWLQEGIMNEEVEKFAKDNGMLFVMNRCMMKEHYSHLIKQ